MENVLEFKTKNDLIKELESKGITENKEGKNLNDCTLLEVGKVYYNKE